MLTEYYGDSEDRILFKDIHIINEEIRKHKLNIIMGLDEDTGQTYYMLINHCYTSE